MRRFVAAILGRSRVLAPLYRVSRYCLPVGSSNSLPFLLEHYSYVMLVYYIMMSDKETFPLSFSLVQYEPFDFLLA